MPKTSAKKITLATFATKTDNLEKSMSGLMVKTNDLEKSIDDLAVMCMREFTSIRKITERIEAHMDAMDARLDKTSEIVLEDHRPRIRSLEMEVFDD